MRDFLTGIAIILIVVLTTVLVAPYFVDWNGQREFLEARLGHALGQKVTVGGTIDLKLLPTPYLVLDQVVVGGDEAPIRIGVRHLNLELAVAPLLHGEFDIVEARLREPTIRLALGPDNALPTFPAAPAFSADVRFERIQISDGTLAVADSASGRTFVFDHLDVDAEAGSFAGPFKINGAEGAAGRRTGFRFSASAAKEGRLHARALVDETPDHASVDFDGTLDLRGTGSAASQSLDGKLIVAGHLPLGETAPVAWKLSGPLQADPKQLRIDGGDLRIGSDEAGLTLQADVRSGLGEGAKAAVDLQAKQIDIDRLAGLPTDGTRGQPPQLPDMATLRRALVAAMPPLPTDLHLAVESATYAGETLGNIDMRTTLGDVASHPLSFAIDGPGGSHATANGVLTASEHPSFSGDLDASAEDLPRLVDWAHSVAPAFSWVGRDARVSRVKAAGIVKASDSEVSSNALSVELDRTKLSGKAALTFATASDRPKLAADVTSDALDLDGLPSLASLRTDIGSIDLALRLAAKAVKVSHVGDGALDTGALRLELETKGDHVGLHALRLSHLGGATLEASGEVDAEKGHLYSTLDADRLEAAAALLKQLAPGTATEALAARASSLTPAKLKLDVSLTAGTSGDLKFGAISVAGNLGATKLTAQEKPATDQSGAMAFSAALQAPDGAPLLRQLGFGTVPIASVGASRLSVTVQGRADGPLDTKLDAHIGASTASIAGRYTLLAAPLSGTGSLMVRSDDLTPFLQTLAIAFPDITGRIPADLKGRLALDGHDITASDLDGRFGGVGARGMLRWSRSADNHVPLTGALSFDRMRLADLVGLSVGHEQQAADNAAWSNQPFASGLVDAPAAALSLTSQRLEVVPGVEATDAKIDLGVAPNQISFRDFGASLNGGRVQGEAKLRRDGRQATVEGKLALSDVQVRVPDTLDTKLSAKLDFAGGGTSALGLVSSLAGSGDATAGQIEAAGADPQALVKIFDDVEADTLAVDQEVVIRAYQDTSKGPLTAGRTSFGLSLAAGIAHFDPQTTSETGPAKSKIDASLDLSHLRLATHVEETLTALPKNWNGPPPVIVVTQQGPIGQPRRSLDVGGFLNVVAARALARESARIEAYELDLRERAFFNERLRSESRREEERQKAEDDAREAEAERKAKAEAARQDRLRKAQEKAAREAEEKAARDQAAQSLRDRGQERSPDETPPNSGPAPAPPPPSEPRDPSSLGRY